MSGPITSRDVQRSIFVESLHKSLRQQDAKLLKDYHRHASVAATYLEDGLAESECVELLMVDGLAREAAEGYTSMAMAGEIPVKDSSLTEFSFRFQDTYGDVWSSNDVGRIVLASDEDDAWIKAQEILKAQTELEAEKLISISRI
jgi:hypothetical protein